MRPFPESARDTVVLETPSASATCSIVIFSVSFAATGYPLLFTELRNSAPPQHTGASPLCQVRKQTKSVLLFWQNAESWYFCALQDLLAVFPDGRSVTVQRNTAYFDRMFIAVLYKDERTAPRGQNAVRQSFRPGRGQADFLYSGTIKCAIERFLDRLAR